MEACSLAGFVSRGDTDKDDSSVMKPQEAPCQASGRGIGISLSGSLSCHASIQQVHMHSDQSTFFPHVIDPT